MNKQEYSLEKNNQALNFNSYSYLDELDSIKFVSADLVQLGAQKSHPDFTAEEIGLNRKIYHTPPRAPRLRPQPVPAQFKSNLQIQLPQSQFASQDTQKNILTGEVVEQAKLSFGTGLSEFQFETQTCLTFAALQSLDYQPQTQISEFIQRPISTYLRQRYESIDTTVTLQDYSGVNMIAALQPTLLQNSSTVDFTITLSDDFDMQDFISSNNSIQVENETQFSSNYLSNNFTSNSTNQSDQNQAENPLDSNNQCNKDISYTLGFLSLNQQQ
eukprot:403368691